MSEFFGGVSRSALLRSTVKAVAAVAFLSYCAADWLSSGAFDRGSLKRLATNVGGPQDAADPVTTGSLADAAKGTKLDPCAKPRRP